MEHRDRLTEKANMWKNVALPRTQYNILCPVVSLWDWQKKINVTQEEEYKIYWDLIPATDEEMKDGRLHITLTNPP